MQYVQFYSFFSFLFGLPLYHRTAPAPIGRILIGRRLTRRSDLPLRRRLRLLRSREACYTRAAAPIDRMYFKGVVCIMPFFKRNPTHRQVPFRRNLGRAFFLHPLLRIELIFGLFQILRKRPCSSHVHYPDSFQSAASGDRTQNTTSKGKLKKDLIV